MKKPVVVLAVVGALALPGAASAVGAEAQVYGTLLPFSDSSRTFGGTSPGLSPATGGASMVPAPAYTGTSMAARMRLTSGTSNLGVKGSLEVNDYLRVMWQIESAVSPDGDAPNALAGRNSCVGLTGSWGTALYGNWDTPYKYPLLFVGPLRGLSPFDNALTASPGFNVPGTTTQSGRSNGKADAAFNRRQGNSVQYWSPVLYGFSARLAYSMNEGRTVATAATATAPATASVSPDLWSGLLTYERGPFVLRYAHERHNDYFGLAQLGGSAGATVTNRASRDYANELVASYAFPTGTKLSAIAERLKYHSDDKVVGAIDGYQRDAAYLLVQQRVGPHQLWGSFGRAWEGSATRVGGGATTTNGLGGRQWSVGYSLALAKQADLFAAYYEMDNDRSASYAVFPSPGTVAPGAATRGFGVGLLYTFSASWSGSL